MSEITTAIRNFHRMMGLDRKPNGCEVFLFILVFIGILIYKLLWLFITEIIILVICLIFYYMYKKYDKRPEADYMTVDERIKLAYKNYGIQPYEYRFTCLDGNNYILADPSKNTIIVNDKKYRIQDITSVILQENKVEITIEYIESEVVIFETEEGDKIKDFITEIIEQAKISR